MSGCCITETKGNGVCLRPDHPIALHLSDVTQAVTIESQCRTTLAREFEELRAQRHGLDQTKREFGCRLLLLPDALREKILEVEGMCWEGVCRVGPWYSVLRCVVVKWKACVGRGSAG